MVISDTPITVIKYLVHCANVLFIIVSIAFISISIFAWSEPPNSGISPTPVSEHRLYMVSVIFLLVTGLALLLLSFLGILSVCYCSTFFISLYIFLLFLQISVQVILSTFAISNRHNVHKTIEETWNTNYNTTKTIECVDDIKKNCDIRQMRSLANIEQIIFIILLGFLTFQVITFALSTVLCELLTRRERYEVLQKDIDDDD